MKTTPLTEVQQRVMTAMSEKQHSSFEPWATRRHRIVSRIGGWRIGEGAFSHGHNITGELAGNISYMQMVMLNVSGRIVSRDVADLIEVTWVGLSWPDPRIWCNQIGALAGSVRTTPVAAMVAGVLASDSTMYGARTLVEGMRLIFDAAKSARVGISVENIVAAEIERARGKSALMGYARPLASGDERVEAGLAFMKKRNMPIGEHLSLALKIEAHLLERSGDSMNLTGFVSAFLADEGFSPTQTYQLYVSSVMSGVVACYADSVTDLPERFLPMRCDDVEYQGTAPRELPERFLKRT